MNSPQLHPDDSSFDTLLVFFARVLAGKMSDTNPVLSKSHSAIDHGRRNITSLRAAISIDTSDPSEDASQINRLGKAYMDVYTQSTASNDLEESLFYLQRAINLTASKDPARASRIEDLAAAFRAKYDATKAPSALDSIIRCCQEAFDATLETSPERVNRLFELYKASMLRSHATGQTAHLEAGIEIFNKGADVALKHQELHQRRIGTLGDLHLALYDRTQDLSNLEKCIQHITELLHLLPDQDPRGFYCRAQLGAAYLKRFERAGSTTDLDASIGKLKAAIGEVGFAKPENSHNRLPALRALARAYTLRYTATKAMSDHVEALKWIQEAYNTIPLSHLDGMTKLSELGTLASMKHVLTRQPADLALAIEQNEKALASIPEHHPERREQTGILATLYEEKYRVNMDEEALKLAIRGHQQLLDTTPKAHLSRSLRLFRIGDLYHSLYKAEGDVIVLERAIELLREALSLPTDSPVNRARILRSLADAHRDRADHGGGAADFEIAITSLDKAINILPSGNDLRAKLRADLTELLAVYSQERSTAARSRIRDPDLLAHTNGFASLHRIGQEHLLTCQKTGDVKAVEKAIQTFRDALKSKRHNKGLLFSLGMAYLLKCIVTRSLSEIDSSIECLEQAIKNGTELDQDRSRILNALAGSWVTKYTRAKEETMHDKAISYFTEASQSLKSPPRDLLRATWNLFRQHAARRNWKSAHDAARHAMDLIPMIAPRALEHTDRQNALQGYGGLASEAVSVALKDGDSPYQALQFLELGRGVILSFLRDVRADISRLKDQHPRLAEDYSRYRDVLDTVPAPEDQQTRNASLVGQPVRVDHRYDAGRKLEMIIKEIRDLPGFDRFLLPPTESELKVAAITAPIVVINASRFSCEAVIIQNQGLRTIPLPRLQHSDIQGYLQILKTPRLINEKLLEWMWDAIAEPVLQALGFHSLPDDDWPHVQWILPGILAYLPIHAAGYHHRSFCSVIDRVISSYASSLRSLVQYPSSFGKLANQSPKTAVLVGAGNLPYVPEEIDKLTQQLRDDIKIQRPAANSAAVLAALVSSDIFHFAGHGHAHPSDPLQSSLLLDNKEQLTVSSIFNTKPHSEEAFLAYLSACGTGRIKADALVDESTHLIAAFQLIGFRHVIGTLWEVDDRSCVEVSIQIYAWIQSRGMSDESVAEALHHTLRQLRAEGGPISGSNKLQVGISSPQD